MSRASVLNCLMRIAPPGRRAPRAIGIDEFALLKGHRYAGTSERIEVLLDLAAVDAALTLPWHNGCTESVDNKAKLLKRQSSGRAGHAFLRHQIPLN
ncbi:hypothetical protein [Streptomyces sp. NPDC055189]